MFAMAFALFLSFIAMHVARGGGNIFTFWLYIIREFFLYNTKDTVCVLVWERRETAQILCVCAVRFARKNNIGVVTHLSCHSK